MLNVQFSQASICRINAHDFASINNDLVPHSCVECCNEPKQFYVLSTGKEVKSLHTYGSWLSSLFSAVNMIFLTHFV